MRVVSTVLVCATLAGCFEEERACYPGDYLECRCDSGERGYSQCNGDGITYGECAFCGTTPGAPASGSGGEGNGGGALLGFLEVCELDEQCASNVCHEFPAKGMFCSQACDGPEDCPPPSSGCNMMGICKAP